MREGRNVGNGGQPGCQKSLETVLVSVTHHIGFTGGFGHDVAAEFLGEKGSESGFQQAIDTILPFFITVGLLCALVSFYYIQT